MQLGEIGFDYVSSEICRIIRLNHEENMQSIRKEAQADGSNAAGAAGQQEPAQSFDALDFSYNKMVSLNFLNYCFENKQTLNFPLDLFEEQDREEIKRFIRNSLYIAFSSHNPKPDDEYTPNQAKYMELLSKIKQTKNGYVLKTETNRYVLPINHFEKVVFYHRYGIDTLPTKAKQSLCGKDFIDAGAYIGDTTLILNEYNPNRIYAFEPCRENLQLMRKTLRLNKISNVTPVPKALGCVEAASPIFSWGNASFLCGEGGQEVQVTTIDDFQRLHNLDVGLIKMDIEGAEYDAVVGAEETIKKQKPSLFISLYHTGKDFFEIPSLLKTWVPNYKFRFLNLHKLAPILERVLVAYVEG